jgi:hypothetical protein
MQAIIYALVDPTTHQVRYVGRTSTRPVERLAEHIQCAQRGDRRLVYEWIRSLAPLPPLLVILQEGVQVQTIGKQGRRGEHPSAWNTAQAAETKWMKRFERSHLLCEIPRDSGAYQTLVNPPGVKQCKRSAS